MKITTVSGSTLALAAASFIVAGAVSAPTVNAAAHGKGQCVGANACKGKSACKTATSECKGHNACKGKGFTMASKADCAKIKGAKFVMPKKS